MPKQTNDANAIDDDLYSPDIVEIRRRKAEESKKGFSINIRPVDDYTGNYDYMGINTTMNKITADELLNKNISINKPLTKMFVQEVKLKKILLKRIKKKLNI